MFQKILKDLGGLPVAQKRGDIAASVIGGNVTIVASATGSGKSLTLPATLAEITTEQVVVLVPRRYLAENAAETVAELSDMEVGQEVGYAVGAQSGEQSRASATTRVLYCTYGYALASGLVNTAKVVVFDEVHEAAMDMSICRALVHRRLAAGEKVMVLEMSATINAARQAAYWGAVAPTSIFEVDGQTHPCERREVASTSPQDAVMALVKEGRKGILVFRPGRGEVEETAEAISKAAEAAGLSVEVSQIYGEMPADERRKAVAAPKDGGVKVLVGTNVLESGVNIPWLDTGMSCGTGKELSVRTETGAVFLQLIELPQLRLEQQEGRVKRFRPGVFVLASNTPRERRAKETTPEIKRLPLTELVLHCATLGLRAESLTLDYAPETRRIVEAETRLQRLGLIDESCQLTKAGKFVTGLPVGPETGAMLWHAKMIGVLGAALPLAAVIEADGVRKDFRMPHGLDNTSDWLDAMKAFALAYGERESSVRKELMEKYNIGYKRFEAAKEMLADLRRRMNGEASRTTNATDSQLRQCIAAGWLAGLMKVEGCVVFKLSGYNSWELGRGGAVTRLDAFAVGQLRTITPNPTPRRPNPAPFTVFEKATSITLADLEAVAAVRQGGVLVKVSRREKVGYFSYRNVITYTLFGVKLTERTEESPLTAAEEAEKAAFEAVREPLRERLADLAEVRQMLGMEPISLGDETWQAGYYGSSQRYTEEAVAAMEAKMVAIVGMYQAIRDLSDRRKAEGLEAVTFTDGGFKLGYYNQPHPYSAEGLAEAETKTAKAIAEKREAKAKLARDAAEGRQRMEALNLRRKALGLPLAVLGEGGFTTPEFYGMVSFTSLGSIADLEAKATKLEMVAQLRPAFEALNQRREALGMRPLELTAEWVKLGYWDSFEYTQETLARLTAEVEAMETERAAEQARLAAEAERRAKLPQLIAAGRARLATLNQRREAMGWDGLPVWDEEFWFEGRYYRFEQEEVLDRVEEQVRTEETSRAEQAKRDAAAAAEEAKRDAEMCKRPASPAGLAALAARFNR